MSVVFVCDRCGGKMMGRPTYQLKRITGNTAGADAIDLCDGCKAEFEAFLAALAEIKGAKWTSQ